MNDINFTGLKNIGGITLHREYLQGLYKGKEDYMIVHLTDDAYGKDLSEFRDVVKSCQDKLGSCTNKDDSRFVHIMTRTVRNTDNEFDNPIPQLFVNGKEIPAERETLPMFSYIAKLTRRISNMENKDFVYNNDFKYSEAGRTYILPHNDLKYVAQSIGLKLEKLLNVVYSPEASKCNAESINKNIHIKMIDYLG